MKVHEIYFYSQFKCTMGNCPDTCCHGWQIVLDDETLQKYMNQTGISGLRLRTSLTKQNGAVTLKGSKGKCPFLSKDRTCQIQHSLGEDYQPEVCRIFPRQRINLGLFAEELLFLACPQACRLFLENLDHLCFNTVEREVSYAKSVTNDDDGYLQELLKIRSAMIDQIMGSALPRPILYAGLLSYAKALQQSCLSNDALDKNVHSYLNETAAPFAIPHDITYAMLTSGFYHIFLKFTSPLLYDLCQIYLKKFRRLTPARGDAQIRALQDHLHHSHPKAERILHGYLSYYLLEDFLTVYEDYSFVRSIAAGIMHIHLLELFFALYYEEKQHLTDDDIIHIITVYTRRGRHNDTIEKTMFDKIMTYIRSDRW